MKQLIKHMAATALLLTAALPIQAQDDNAAFYIYQNDGHFEGFFYDEVQKISYSKLDTLGVEHEDFVSQEIITADSTYRIMLSAIDSIGFVQPEIILNPNLRDTRKEGMLDYLTSIDEETITLTFSLSMPDNLRPRVGDVLVDYDTEVGFSGKVQNVTTTGDAIIVNCTPLESIHDIFHQFITVEEYGQNRQGKTVRRRVAGVPELNFGEFPSKSRSRTSSIDLNVLEFSFSKHFILFTDSLNNWNVSIDVNAEAALNVKASWNFPWIGDDRVSITFALKGGIGGGFTVDYKFKDSFEIKANEFGKIPVPAAAPVFMLETGPNGFLRGEAHVKFGMQSPKFTFGLWGRLDIVNWIPVDMDWGLGTPPSPPDEEVKPENNDWAANLEFNGFLQLGVAPKIGFGTNKLLEKVLRCSVDAAVYIGPKLSGVLSFDLLNMAENGFDDLYGNLKESKLTYNELVADYEAKSTVKLPFGSQREATIADGSFNILGNIDCYLFPEFELDAKAEEYGSYGKITATLKTSRTIFFPIDVGVGLYKDGELFWYSYSTNSNAAQPFRRQKYWQFNKEWKTNKSSTFNVHQLRGGEYDLRPIININNNLVPCTPVIEKIKVPGVYIKAPHLLKLDSDGSKKTYAIDTNCQQMELLDNGYRPGQEKIKAEWNDKILSLSAPPLHGALIRVKGIRFWGLYSADENSNAIGEAYSYVRQFPDMKLNRLRLMDQIVIPVECAINDTVITLHAHKDEDKEIDNGEGDGWDVDVTLAVDTLNWVDPQGKTIKASIKSTGKWYSASYDLYHPDMMKVSYTYTAENGILRTPPRGWPGWSEFDHSSAGYSEGFSNSFTLKRTTYYAKYDEEKESYVLTEEKTEDLTSEYANTPFYARFETWYVD